MKKAFVYKLNRLTPAGGFMLENGNYGHGMLSETFMTAFLTTAMQRAYRQALNDVEQKGQLQENPIEHNGEQIDGSFYMIYKGDLNQLKEV